jgi:hypothetical protein
MLFSPRYAGAAIDLIVTNIKIYPSSPQVGTDVTYTAVLKNQGSTSANETFYIKWYLDGSYCDESSISGGLSAGYTTEESTDEIMCQPETSGSHTIKVYVDSSKDIEESNENNNELAKSWTWLPEPKPDLFISKFELKPEDPVIGEYVEIIATVKNQGNADAVKVFYVGWYLDKYLCEETEFEFGLKKGYYEEISPTLEECFPDKPGEHDLEIVVDYTKKIDESDENNNKKLVIIKWYETGPEPDEMLPESGEAAEEYGSDVKDIIEIPEKPDVSEAVYTEKSDIQNDIFIPETEEIAENAELTDLEPPDEVYLPEIQTDSSDTAAMDLNIVSEDVSPEICEVPDNDVVSQKDTENIGQVNEISGKDANIPIKAGSSGCSMNRNEKSSHKYIFFFFLLLVFLKKRFSKYNM